MTKTKSRSERGRKAGRPDKRPAVADGLSREEIERANAGGPGEVARLIAGARAKGPKGAKATPTPKRQRLVAAGATPFAADPRLPKPGTVLERDYKGETLRVTVREDGFEYRGTKFRSLSGLTRVAVLNGAQVNGYLFWGLTPRPTAKGTKCAPRQRDPKESAPTPASVPTTTERPTKATPTQTASLAKARAARAAKVAACKAEQKK